MRAIPGASGMWHTHQQAKQEFPARTRDLAFSSARRMPCKPTLPHIKTPGATRAQGLRGGFLHLNFLFLDFKLDADVHCRSMKIHLDPLFESTTGTQ